jgi:hypothetical protein
MIFGAFYFMADSFIKKTKRTNNFTVLGNQIFSSGLSLEALGILCFILHLPDDWVLRKSHLMKLFKIGRDKTDRLFKELKAKGYIADVIRLKGEDGRFDGVHYLVYDNPLPDNHTTENHPTEIQYPGNPTTTKNEVDKELNTQRTNLTKGKSSNSANPIADNEEWVKRRTFDNLDELFKFNHDDA